MGVDQMQALWKRYAHYVLTIIWMLACLGLAGQPSHAANEGVMKTDIRQTSHGTIKVESIATLRSSGGVSSPCGQRLPREGRRVYVLGFIDKNNIFDRAHYPQLPYEKFILTNRDKTSNLEVWVEAEQGEKIFADIWHHIRQGKNVVVVNGILRGVDLPIMGVCKRDVQIVLNRDGGLSWE
jgi:hypothetical protein